MSNGDEKESSYVGRAFAPIFLFKTFDKLMFEAELEFVLRKVRTRGGLGICRRYVCL